MANRFLNNIKINDSYTLPSADGSANQVITTDGAGNLSFIDVNSVIDTATGEVYYTVKNSTGSTLSKGKAVMAVGSDGNSGHILVDEMIADGSIEPRYFLGVLAENIGNGNTGKAIHFGQIDQFNTNGQNGEVWNDGQVLWCDPVNDGDFTITEPDGPNVKIAAAIVLNAATNGKIQVRVQANEGIHDLHDTKITSQVDGDVLVWNETDGVWFNDSTLNVDYTAGRVGIGTTDPTSTLQVDGQVLISATAPFLDFVDTNSFTDVDDRFRVRAGVNQGLIQWYDASTASTQTIMSLNPNADVDIVGNLTANNFSGSSSGTNTGDQDLSGYLTTTGKAADSNLLDGLNSTQFLRSDANDSFTGNLTTGANNHITFGPNSSWGSSLRIGGNGRTATGTEMASVVTTDGNLHLDAADSVNSIYLNYYAGTGGVIFGNGNDGVVARMDASGNLYKATTSSNITSTYWHSGNDGSGSGLDADLLDGQHASAFLTSETDTLDSVADRGRTTNQQLISTNPSGFRVDSGTSARIEIDSNNDWSYIRLQDNATTSWDIASYNGGQLELRPGGFSTNRTYFDASGNSFSEGSKRAPIFYDSNNTAYYLDPGNSSTSAKFAGNVGIGTTSPGAKLEVKTSSYNAGNAIANFVNGNDPTRVSYDTVVIAQTDVPTLSIVETIDGSQANEQKLTFSVGDNKAVIASTSTATNGMYFNVNRDVDVPGYNTGNGITALKISNNGNVGIGTTSPGEKLTVSGNGRFTGGSSGTLTIKHNYGFHQPNWGIKLDGDTNTSGGYLSQYINLGGFALEQGGTYYGGGPWRTDTNSTSYSSVNGVSGQIVFYTNTSLTANSTFTPSERMRIDSSGNVGIGTSSPSEKLTVTGNIQLTDKANSVLFGSAGGDGTWGAPKITRIGSSLIMSDYSGIQLGGYNGSSYGARMVVKGTGEVGIGTTLPGYTLDVNGTIHSTNLNIADHIFHEGDTNTYMQFHAADQWRVVTGGVERFEVNNSQAYASHSLRAPIFYNSANTSYYLDPANISNLNAVTATRIGVNPSGSSTSKYGISLYSGFSSGEPTYGLLFTGTGGLGTHGAVTSDWATYFTMSNSNSRGWIFRKAGSANSASISAGGVATFDTSVNSPIFYDSNNTAYYFDGSSTGDSIRVAGDVVAYYSDERLKDKKGNIENALDKVLSLNGFYYEPNEKAQSLGYKKKLEVGVSAQEVEEVLPEIIKDAPIGNGYKTLDYSKLTPLLIEAIKEQQKQIEELKKMIS